MTDNFNGRYQSLLTALLLLVFTGLLAWLSERYSYTLDWTRGGRHNLSGASHQVLDRMPGKIEVTSYASDDVGLRELIRGFVSRYQRYKADISLQFINPDSSPAESRNLGIEVDGELVIRYQDRLQHVLNDSEHEFTNALQRLLRGTDLWLAFLEGHGERSPLGDAGHDLSLWVRQLQNRGLNLQPINLASLAAIPDNTFVLVIASPRTAYLPGEVSLIRDYLERGGNLLWLLDPGEGNGLEELASYLGLEFPDGTIIETNGQVIGISDPTIALSTRQLYGRHPAVAGFDLTTLFPSATAIDAHNSGSWRVTPVVTSATRTWLERGELKGDVRFDQGQDLAGPFTIAVSLERELSSGDQQRIMVIGDGDFIANNYIDNQGNLELGLRVVDWLAQSEDFISIPARTVEDADLQLSRLASIVMGFGLLVFLPVGLLTTGGLIWWRRRQL
ncbi:MAG: ABC transporter [Gammaproteobacteria bacterium]|nr:ABC transporter [Gammaproteobacteria bacterium]